MPNPRYDEQQPGFTWFHRKAVIVWFFQLQAGADIPDEIVWGASNLFDRFLTRRVVPLQNIEVVALVAFAISAKYEMIAGPTFKDLLRITGLDVSIKKMCAYESYLLNVHGPSSLRRIATTH